MANIIQIELFFPCDKSEYKNANQKNYIRELYHTF